MTCLECRDLMLEVAGRRAAPFVEHSVASHVAECTGCRARLEQEHALTAALGEIARDADGASASAEVERRLMAAFVTQAEATGATTFSSQGVVSRWPAAAALLLAAGVTAWWGLRSEPVAHPAALAVQAPQPSTPAAVPSARLSAAASKPRAEISGAARAGSTRRAARVVTAAAAPPPIEAVGFVPIPSAAGLPAFESGEIVRLGIPVTALPNYGVDIPAGGSASVEADLLVGQDGQARAIRLVTGNADASRARQEKD